MSETPHRKLDWIAITGIVLGMVTSAGIPLLYAIQKSASDRALTDYQLVKQAELNQVYFRRMERIEDKQSADQVAIAKMQQRQEDDERFIGLPQIKP